MRGKYNGKKSTKKKKRMENTPSPASKEELRQEEVQVVGKKIERHCLILVTIKMIIKSEHVCLKENYKQQQLQKITLLIHFIYK